MRIGRLQIKASRWPWQLRTSAAILSCPKTERAGMRYGWKPTGGMGRFGGGWNWKLGFALGSTTLMIDLLFGMVTIKWLPKEKKA